jgi:hypothetical protein
MRRLTRLGFNPVSDAKLGVDLSSDEQPIHSLVRGVDSPTLNLERAPRVNAHGVAQAPAAGLQPVRSARVAIFSMLCTRQ